MVARRIDSESCVLTKFIVVLYGLVHLSARRAANRLTKCSPSRCRTPSVVTTKGVKSARRSQQASWCLFFFALARLSRTAVTWRLTYDWASALQTRKSNNASVCGCHTPRTASTARSHTRPLPSPCSRDSRTTGSRVTCAYAMEASKLTHQSCREHHSLMKTLDWRVMLTTTLGTSEQQRYLFLLSQDSRSRSLQDIVETRR